MQAAGQSITNQPAILLFLSLFLSPSQFAITHEAGQIYYSQNYCVADTNE